MRTSLSILYAYEYYDDYEEQYDDGSYYDTEHCDDIDNYPELDCYEPSGLVNNEWLNHELAEFEHEEEPDEHHDSSTPSPSSHNNQHLVLDPQHPTVHDEYTNSPYEADCTLHVDNIRDLSQVHPCYWLPNYHLIEPNHRDDNGEKYRYKLEGEMYKGKDNNNKAWQAELARYGVTDDDVNAVHDEKHTMLTFTDNTDVFTHTAHNVQLPS